jgi:transcriptional regulator with XRE-family HTH domain
MPRKKRRKRGGYRKKEALVLLGKRIRAFRERLGITATEAARRAGMSLKQWSAYEVGARGPSLANCFKLCDVLGVMVEDLESPLLIPDTLHPLLPPDTTASSSAT